MLSRFIENLKQQHLLPHGQEVLLAVSGGRDSVCLAHLFHSAAIPFAVAHCNFHLRPGDCDRDEAFVRRLAQDYGVACHVASFDTRAAAAAAGQSVEEAARDLRYRFFASLSPLVATAHHRDDSVETFFLNLFRGTGIAGLHGIRPVSEMSIGNVELRIVRPMLCFSRADIDAYIDDNHLDFVEDHTNALLDARRNQIRHRLMPLLRQLYPSIDRTMADNIGRLYDTELVYKDYIESLRSSLVTRHPSPVPDLPFEILSLDLPSLRSQFSILNSQFSILFELIHPFGFNASQVSDILRATENGKLFYSATHIAELHGGRLLIAPETSSLRPGEESHRMAVGEDSVTRPWQPGDRIRLKKGSRLVSDYLKDLGLSRIERRYVLVDVDGQDRVLSIVGLAIGE